MMRIIRVFNITKRNPCVFQNPMQGYKAPAQQAVKMSISSDALKEPLKVENEIKDKKFDGEDRRDANKNENLGQVNFTKEFAQNILYQNKDRLTNALMEMPASSVVTIMKNLCSSKSRPLDILNIMSEKLQSNPSLNLLQCSTVLYCSAVLNFRDPNLIKIICEQIAAEKSNFVSHKLPVNIMRSLGVLRYHNKEVLELLTGSILHFKKATPDDLVTVLLTLALVNCDTPFVKPLIKVLSGYSEVDYSQPESYLNFVWSCVVLNELDPTHISRVLSEDFLNKVLSNEKKKPNLLKLQNIHGAASFMLNSYSSSLLNEYHLNLFPVKKSKTHLLEGVKNTLYYICPKDGFLKLNVDTSAGFCIDVACQVNPQGEIIRLKSNNGSHNVGFLLLDYHDFCLGSDTITGINAFKSRLIQAKGFKPLFIPYTEFSLSSRLSVKIDYLRKKLRSIV